MRAFNGVFSGNGHSPHLTRICSRISLARASHSLFDSIFGKVRGVFKSLTAPARWSEAGNVCAGERTGNAETKTANIRRENSLERILSGATLTNRFGRDKFRLGPDGGRSRLKWELAHGFNDVIHLLVRQSGIDREGENSFRHLFGHGKIAGPIAQIRKDLLQVQRLRIVNEGRHSPMREESLQLVAPGGQ